MNKRTEKQKRLKKNSTGLMAGYGKGEIHETKNPADISRRRQVMVKVYDPALNKEVWTHFCYIHVELYNRFCKTLSVTRGEIRDYISDWYLQQFGKIVPLTTIFQLTIMKKDIRQLMLSQFEGIPQGNVRDNQGLVTVWLTEKMERELKYANETKRD